MDSFTQIDSKGKQTSEECKNFNLKRRNNLDSSNLKKIMDNNINKESDEQEFDYESKSKSRTRSNYSVAITKILMDWLQNHLNNPYPSEEDRIQLCEVTGLSRKQLRIWMIDARRRKLKKINERISHYHPINTKIQDNSTSQINSESIDLMLNNMKKNVQRELNTTIFDLFENYCQDLNKEYCQKLLGCF